MEWTLILTAVGTLATIVSTVVAVRAKNEATKILQQIKEESRNITSNGEIDVINNGSNSGIMSGINSGEIY